jgi:hypothetical protein
VNENEEFQGAVKETEVCAAGVEGAEEHIDMTKDLERGAKEGEGAEVDWVCDDVREVRV